MRLTPRSLVAAPFALVGLLGLAACGDDGDSSSADAAAEEENTADDAASDADDTSTPADWATLTTADTDLGTILVDGEGRTLYLFMPDDKGPSTCVDECLANWPAVEAPVEAGEGVDEALLGTAERPDDGSDQATYNDWPLYYFANDAEPGDTSGQGVSDVWFVIGADGRAIPAAG